MSDGNNGTEFITIVVPTGPYPTVPGEVADIETSDPTKLHSLPFDWGSKAEEIDWDKFHNNWKKIQDQIQVMLTDLKDKAFGDLELDELIIGLSVTGKGSIGIASVAAAADIKLNFKRKVN